MMIVRAEDSSGSVNTYEVKGLSSLIFRDAKTDVTVDDTAGGIDIAQCNIAAGTSNYKVYRLIAWGTASRGTDANALTLSFILSNNSVDTTVLTMAWIPDVTEDDVWWGEWHVFMPNGGGSATVPVYAKMGWHEVAGDYNQLLVATSSKTILTSVDMTKQIDLILNGISSGSGATGEKNVNVNGFYVEEMFGYPD
jgi:hypothetical protein